MAMIKDRNQTSHTYNQATGKAIVENITTKFFNLFIKLQEKMQVLHDEN